MLKLESRLLSQKEIQLEQIINLRYGVEFLSLWRKKNKTKKEKYQNYIKIFYNKSTEKCELSIQLRIALKKKHNKMNQKWEKGNNKDINNSK